jgi:hypothetical protein
MSDYRCRLSNLHARRIEQFTGKIEPADGSIFVQVAQDIRKLERAPQMMGKLPSRLILHAEDADRKAPKRTRNTIAIEIEGGKIGRTHIGNHIHFHTVDCREEILFAQSECTGRPRQAGQARRHPAIVKRLEIRSPSIEIGLAFIPRQVPLVRYIVNGPTECIDSEHRLAFLTREKPHSHIERTV